VSAVWPVIALAAAALPVTAVLLCVLPGRRRARLSDLADPGRDDLDRFPGGRHQ
jgi:hypothetical protein